MLRLAFVSFILVLWGFGTSAEPVQPLRGFETGKAATSVALLYIPERDRVLVALAHGDEGVSIYTDEGRQIWHRSSPAQIVAPDRRKFKVFEKEPPTALFDILIGHGGSRISIGQRQSPAPVAPTTLQRTSIAALGPVRIDGSTLRSATGVVHFAQPIIDVGTMKKPETASWDDGLFATVTRLGRVDIFPLDQIRRSLLP